jgi:hypothetical protein
MINTHTCGYLLLIADSRAAVGVRICGVTHDYNTSYSTISH